MLTGFRRVAGGVSARSAGAARRTSLATCLTAAALGVAIGAVDASAALAAPGDPTISVPSLVTGYGRISITGTAAPGATVYLHEAAFAFKGAIRRPTADEIYFPEDKVWDEADSNGAFQLSRVVDSGFVFAVEANGRMSDVKTVSVKVLAELQVSAAGSDGVTATVTASPGQPDLPVQLERSAGSTWTTIADDYTKKDGVYTVTLGAQPVGARYRAKVGGDELNALVASDYTEPVLVGGRSDSGNPTTPEPPSTTPPPSTPEKPSTPTPPTKPTTPPKPTPPKPTTPATAVGAVQLTKVVYDSPGKDTGTNASLNGEYVRLTNRTKKPINLRNWTLRDAAGHVYTFTTDHSLGAGKNVYVLTGKGTDGTPAAHRYWGSKGYIWNNGGDTASLRDATKKTIDSCRWTKDSNLTYC